MGGLRRGPVERACTATAAHGPAWQPHPHTSTVCRVWHLFQLFPDRDLLGQIDHFLDRKESPIGLGLRRVNTPAGAGFHTWAAAVRPQACLWSRQLLADLSLLGTWAAVQGGGGSARSQPPG